MIERIREIHEQLCQLHAAAKVEMMCESKLTKRYVGIFMEMQVLEREMAKILWEAAELL